MTTKEIDYLDGEITVVEEVPSTVQELVELLGEDAVVQEATGNLYYRNKYPRVYKAVSKKVDETGFKRAIVDTKVSTTGIKKDIFESVNDHLRRFLDGEVGDPVKNEAGELVAGEKLTGDYLIARRTQITELFTSEGQSQPLYVKGERTGGGNGKISAEALANANKFFAAGSAKVEQVAALIEGQVPGYKVLRDTEDEVTPETLARGLQALTKHMQRQAMLAMQTTMAGLA